MSAIFYAYFLCNLDNLTTPLQTSFKINQLKSVLLNLPQQAFWIGTFFNSLKTRFKFWHLLFKLCHLAF